MHPAGLQRYDETTIALPGVPEHDRERLDEDAGERVNIRVVTDDDTARISEKIQDSDVEARPSNRQIAYTIEEYDWSGAMQDQSGLEKVDMAQPSAATPVGVHEPADEYRRSFMELDERFNTGYGDWE